MSPRIDGSNSYRPTENTEAEQLTPQQRVMLQGARTPEERIKILNRHQPNEVQQREFKARGEDAPKSPLGQKLSDGFDQATHDLPPGGKLEVGAEVEAGEGVELVGRTKIEVENTGHGWEVARTIGGEVAAGVHAGGIFEGKAGIAFDVTEHYEYSTREAARSASTAMAQANLPDDVTDPDVDLRLNRSAYARAATSFSVSSELFGKVGGAVGPFGADAEGKAAGGVRVKVNEHTGDMNIEFGPEASERIGGRAGLSAGVLGATAGADGQAFATSLKAEFQYKLTPGELKLWIETRDPRVLGQAIARGAVGAKVTEKAEMVIGGERLTGKRELSLDASGKRVTAGIQNDLQWSRGASTTSFSVGVETVIANFKCDAKRSTPGVKMVGVTTEQLKHSGIALRKSEADLVAHRARANVGH